MASGHYKSVKIHWSGNIIFAVSSRLYTALFKCNDLVSWSLLINKCFILSLHNIGHRRKIKDAINIHRGKPSLNRDIGQEHLPGMLQLVSHDVSHVTRL